MLTAEDLQVLHEACSAVADSNWGGEVQVTQRENGSLVFSLVDEDEDVQAIWYARPVGQLAGHEVYAFWQVGEEEDAEYDSRLCTLVPSMICGLMGL